MIGAVFFPAWVWIKRPEYRFLYSSYKAEYARKWFESPTVMLQVGRSGERRSLPGRR
jgi:hypothetical protein